jgi:hypothetical protein
MNREIHLPKPNLMTSIRGASGVDTLSKEDEEHNLWASRALAEVPADRPRAEKAVSDLYRLVGVPAPSLFVWVKSPEAMRRVVKSFREVYEEKESQATLDFCLGIYNRLAPKARTRFWDDDRLVRSKMAELVTLPPNYFPRPQLRSLLEQRMSDAIELGRDPDLDCESMFAGQWFLPALLDWRDSMENPKISREPPENYASILDAFKSLVISASFWRPYRAVCVMCERPTKIALDSMVRFHNAKGKALQWPDGWGVYRLSGMIIEGRYIEDCQSLTVSVIESERNVELRRSLIELYGEERYLKDSGACVVSVGRNGARLWSRSSQFDSSPFQMVEVINSTPEADGTSKHYFIRVPPTVTSADEAVAWTWTMTADVYEPSVET